MPAFVPGLQLSALYYKEAVKPIMKNSFPELKYAAGLLGWGVGRDGV